MTDVRRRPERPSRWALLTVLPVVLLGLGELVALTNRRTGDTLTEVTLWLIGDRGSLQAHLVTGWTAAWLGWLALHWLVSARYWGPWQLVVLIACALLCAGVLYLIQGGPHAG